MAYRRKIEIGFVEISGLNWTRRHWRYRESRADLLFGSVHARPSSPATYAFLPYSTALLQDYALRHAERPDDYEFRLPVYKRTAVDQAVERLLGSDIVGFSTYCWNIELSLSIARRLREIQPETLIVFGGPQVPDHAEPFLRTHRFIDIVCHGEGERTFLEILEGYSSRDWSAIPSVSYLLSDGGFVHQTKGNRIADLSTIPSPYLDGVFTRLIAANPHERWHVLWETNRGCPFSCTFCDWGSAIASKVYQFDMDRLRAEIDWFADQEIEFLFCCDANFGILPRDVEIAEYVLETRERGGFPVGIGVQNTKNATERAYRVQKMLAPISRNGVTISLQSTHPQTLKSVKRDNISTDSYRELQQRYTRDGIETYTDMILSLPGETYATWANGIAEVIENGQYNRIQFYNCFILPNAEMGDPEYQRAHGVSTVRVRSVNPHDPLDVPPGEVSEYLELVVATDSMPNDEWIKAKALWWATDLLFFDRLLQIPFVLMRELYDINYRTLIEAVGHADASRYPLLATLQRMFFDQAREIQKGGDEYIDSAEWLNISWPANHYALISLATEWKTDEFYVQAEDALLQLLRQHSIDADEQLLHEAFELNRNLLRLPFHIDDLEVELTHNVWEFYRSVLNGTRISLERGRYCYHIDRVNPMWLSWDAWYEGIISRYNDKAAFLYPLRRVSDELRASDPAHRTRPGAALRRPAAAGVARGAGI